MLCTSSQELGLNERAYHDLIYAETIIITLKQKIYNSYRLSKGSKGLSSAGLHRRHITIMENRIILKLLFV